MADPTEHTTSPGRTYDGSIGDMVKSLINDLVEESQKTHGETPRDRIRNHLKFQAGESTLHGITALASYMTARAQERQATAMESIAKTAGIIQRNETANIDAQAVVDQRGPKRDYLSTTYSLPTDELLLLWTMRGVVMDAAIKSLSRPTSYEVYERVSTDEIAWGIRITPEEFYRRLPHTPNGDIDYGLLEAFGIYHYGGTDANPDVWMFGG